MHVRHGCRSNIFSVATNENELLPPYLLQCAGNVRLHLRFLREYQTGQQGGALLGRQRAQDVLEQQLGQQQLVAADLTGHAALQLHRPATVHVLERLQHLRDALTRIIYDGAHV